MIDAGYTKKINYLENNVRVFPDITDGQRDFDIHNVRNCNSICFYGVLNNRVNQNYYQLPSKQFNNITSLIDNGLPNDINSYMILKDKSIYGNKFLINYSILLRIKEYIVLT